MEESSLLVHVPEDGETLKHYLQRYTPAERQRLYEHKIKSKELCSTLVNNQWPLESKEKSIEKGLENLWKILERLNNFRRLLHFIELLEPIRQDLLDSLDEYGEDISDISKLCRAGRMISSTVDTVSTLGGLFFAVTKPGGGDDNWALGVAALFGFVSLSCSVVEVKLSSDAFSDLMEKVHMDQKYFSEIQSWYQKSSELEDEMLNIFPFDFTEKIIKEFIATGEHRQPDPVNLLSVLLKGLKSLKIERIKGCTKKEEQNSVQESTENNNSENEVEDEETLTESLIRFVKSEKARELCYSLFVRRQHPIIFDIAKMALQFKYSSWPFYACQSLSSIAPRNRIAYTLRIGLNLYCMCEDIRSIGTSSRHEQEIKQLRKHLECEMIALKKISVFIRLRSNGLIL